MSKPACAPATCTRPGPKRRTASSPARWRDWHFAPTATSRGNLLGEGVAPETIHVTGNTVIDALLQVREQIVANADAAATI